MHNPLRFLTALACLALPLAALAQPVITNADMPVAGDTLRMSTAATVGSPVDVTQTGANFTWDYSALTPNGQTLLSYKNANSTPYVLYFFNQFGQKIADSIGVGTFKFTNVYTFFKKSATKYQADGIGLSYSGFPLGSPYTDKDDIFKFPLQYNDRDSDTYAYEVSLPAVGTYGSKGYRITEADGWGTLTTPYGTFQTLRVKSTIMATDTIGISAVSFGFAFPNNRIEYRWLAVGQRAPLLIVTGSVLAGQFAPTSLQYRDNARSFAGIANVAADALGLAIYPNPAPEGSPMHVRWSVPATRLSACDMAGRTLWSMPLHGGIRNATLPATPAWRPAAAPGN